MDQGLGGLDASAGGGFSPPAAESAAAVLEYGKNVLNLPRIIAMVDAENGASVRLVEKLGLTFERMVRMPGESDEINLYTTVFE